MIDGVLALELPTSPAGSPARGPAGKFIVGPENQLVAPPLEQLLDLAAVVDSTTPFNPLVITGPSGSGKSHLVQGVVRHWQSLMPPEHAGYFTAADFGREFQAAHDSQRLPSWRSHVRSLRLAVIEDLQRLRTNAAIQQELRETIDALVDRGAAIIVTADREPVGIPELDAGLIDRLAGGLAVRLQRPGVEARRAILEHVAHSRGLAISEDQLQRLARREVGAVAQLLGELANLDAASRAGQGATPGEPAPDAARDHQQIKQIIAVTARYFSITQSALVGPSRRTSLVRARNVVVHLARQLTGLSYSEIGRSLGGRDHTTILHAARRIGEQLAHDPQVQQDVDELDRILRS